MNSILDSTKEKLGIDSTITDFDSQLIDAINTALAILTQNGVGPIDGFEITSDEDTWDDFYNSDPKSNMIRNYVHLQTRLLFDPPTSGIVTGSIERQCDMLLWRIRYQAETEVL